MPVLLNVIQAKSEPGQFVDENGTVLGTHKGIAHYTIGQRKGLGISFGEPMFVTKINAEQNQIVLGKAGSQYAKQLVAGDINWISIERLTEPLKATAKTRYQAPPCTCGVATNGKWSGTSYV